MNAMEENGQGWRIQVEYGFDTRMMYWRKRLVERLENSDQHEDSEIMPMLAKRNFTSYVIPLHCLCSEEDMPYILICLFTRTPLNTNFIVFKATVTNTRSSR